MSGLFCTSCTFSDIVHSIVSILNITVEVLAVLALVVFFVGLVRYVYQSGDAHAHIEARERIIWSLVALFVLMSMWGILAVMNTAFFGGSSGSSYNPYNTSTGSYNP